jgi:putative PIN family toxin of toxin-antitoxin system
MIVVLDTNVIISALLSSRGAPAKLLSRWENNEFEVAVSPQLLAELGRALHYPNIARYLKLSEEEIGTFLRHYVGSATLIISQENLEVITQDPDDNRILECAVDTNASFIVTGDAHLLKLEEYRGIVILPPAAFLAYLIGQTPDAH